MQYLIELWKFFLANARASYFGAFLLAIFLVTEVVTVPYLSRYDFIFLSAVAFNEVSSFDLRFRFLDPDEHELAASEQRIAVKEGIKNLRVRTKFSSVPIVKSGDCWLVVEVKGVDEDGYAEVQRLPLETAVKTDI